jgi:hypothetical protein
LRVRDKDKETDKSDDNYDRLWKIREVSDTLNAAYFKFYNPSEHLATDRVTVTFQGKVAFKQYIPKKNTRFKK